MTFKPTSDGLDYYSVVSLRKGRVHTKKQIVVFIHPELNNWGAQHSSDFWTDGHQKISSTNEHLLRKENHGLGAESQFLFVCFLLFKAVPRHMEVPRLGVKSELQLPASITAMATPDPSRVCRPTPQLTATPDP